MSIKGEPDLCHLWVEGTLTGDLVGVPLHTSVFSFFMKSRFCVPIILSTFPDRFPGSSE